MSPLVDSLLQTNTSSLDSLEFYGLFLGDIRKNPAKFVEYEEKKAEKPHLVYEKVNEHSDFRLSIMFRFTFSFSKTVWPVCGSTLNRHWLPRLFGTRGFPWLTR